MRKTFFALSVTALCAFMAACGNESGTNTSTNAKPANAAANTTAAAPAADPAAAQAEVRKLMDAAQAALAKNDADAMEKIYADNYKLVNMDGSVQTKAERLASLRSGEAKYTAFTYSEPDIRVSADASEAVVIAKLSLKGTFRGKATDGEYRVTQVYSKMKDGWRQVSAQATPITAADAKTADAKPDEKKAEDKKEEKSAAPANK